MSGERSRQRAITGERRVVRSAGGVTRKRELARRPDVGETREHDIALSINRHRVRGVEPCGKISRYDSGVAERSGDRAAIGEMHEGELTVVTADRRGRAG